MRPPHWMNAHSFSWPAYYWCSKCLSTLRLLKFVNRFHSKHNSLPQSALGGLSTKSRNCNFNTLPSRLSSSITLCRTCDVWEPGSKKHLTTFENPLDPQKIAGTVGRITYPTELTATEFAMTEDDTRGLDDEDGSSGTDSTLTSSKWGHELNLDAGDCDVCLENACMEVSGTLQLCDQVQGIGNTDGAFLNLSFTGNDRKLTYDFKPWFL